jgi:5-deoxy-5-amino-3-dehydroquinate synthase
VDAVDTVAETVTAKDAYRRIDVDLNERSYSVRVGAGVRHSLPEIVESIGARKAVVVSARPEEWTPDPGVPRLALRARDGERHKTWSTVLELCRAFADYGLTRRDVVISCGGGTTTDTVGFAAAVFHRGTAVIHLPTTLLAQVDASIGGKTAINLPEGKNLVGAYWQPRAVLCDTEYLQTLPDRERTNGYGELARCHFIGVEGIHRLPLSEQITASIARKAQIVAADERDSGLRHLLNYGHTLGHAVEVATDFRVRHGEAVAVGTVFAGRLAEALGRIGEARREEHRTVVAGYGLPTELPAGLDDARLIELMRLDKKAVSGLAFVLDGPHGAELVADVPADLVADTLARMPRER